MNLSDSPYRRPLKSSQSRIRLLDGRELQFHSPATRVAPQNLAQLLPAQAQGKVLELEIGPGKGEFLSQRAQAHPDRFFVGIDRRVDRIQLTQKKLARLSQDSGKNWLVIREDARVFLQSALPPLQVLHVYHPDPWPKARHHKHRFFRSPQARQWAQALVPGGELRLSTDHRGYFEEILDVVAAWNFLRPQSVLMKTHYWGAAVTHFEGIFLNKREPVYKATFVRV